VICGDPGGLHFGAVLKEMEKRTVESNLFAHKSCLALVAQFSSYSGIHGLYFDPQLIGE